MASFSLSKAIYLIFSAVVSIFLILILASYYNRSIIDSVRLLSLIQLLLPIAAVDFKRQKIPNKLLLIMLILRIIIFGTEALLYKDGIKSLLMDYLVGMLCVGGFFLLMLIAFKKSIGMGDVKLFAVLGLYQGLWGAINSVCFSLAISFVVAVCLLASKRKGRKDMMSFGPSILAGSVIAICLSGM